METALPDFIGTFAGLRVAVVGESVLDSYLEGTTGRLCHEAPVPIVAIESRSNIPGGAANAAVNARRLGAEVSLVSVVGDDADSQLLRSAMRHRGLSCEHLLTDQGRQTLAKHRVVSDGQMLVRFDQGTTAPISGEVEERLLEEFAREFLESDAVIVSDYGHGIVTRRLIDALRDLQASSPRVLVIDSRRNLSAYRHVQATAVKPNYREAMRLLGLDDAESMTNRVECMARHGRRILERTGAQIATVTLDRDGAILFERGRPPYRTYAKTSRAACACGAGDTFVSALTLALASGAHPPAAVELASAAAAVVVGKANTADCSADELYEYVSDAGKYAPDAARLATRLAVHRQAGRKIVLTNGCFDILHRGHIAYLNQAKSLGDVLIVGVNTDRSIARLKGPQRPINPLEDRVGVLSGLSAVDYIVAFDEDTPCELVRAIRPDVFVKGGDYTLDTLPEASVVAECGGTVQILPYLDDRSTSKIIQRIQQHDASC